MPHTPGSVQSRCQLETDGVAVDRLAGQPCRIDERLDPRILRMRQAGESEMGDDAVLAGQRHYVSDGAQGS